jgi:hypothetical protein
VSSAEPERTQLLDALEQCRGVSTNVTRKIPIGSELYRRNDALLKAIDDVVEALTGDRTKFWLKPHSNVRFK